MGVVVFPTVTEGGGGVQVFLLVIVAVCHVLYCCFPNVALIAD